MKLIYIGESFYSRSNTMMSSIYDEFGYRQDWGKVQIALTAGESVEIRPATPKELEEYEAALKRLQHATAI